MNYFLPERLTSKAPFGRMASARESFSIIQPAAKADGGYMHIGPY